MRTEAEILRAHDLLVSVITDKVPNPFSKDPKAASLLMANCDVLCWLLGHEHNKTFVTNIESLERWLAENHGLVMPHAHEPDQSRSE